MVWIAKVARDPSMRLDQVHVALYGYFPQVAFGEGRPYLWRLMSKTEMLVASRLRPTAPGAREIRARAGTTYDFRLVFKRVRNVRGIYRRPDGTLRKRTPRPVTISSHDELKDRVRQFVSGRGGDVTYVRIDGMRDYEPAKGLVLPICDAVGKVFVRDEEAFDAFLASGGPGTGKAYGLGLWYLPEIMGEVMGESYAAA